MFEQSLYEQAPVTTPLHEGDLFFDYEIKGWELSSRIYKIIGVAAIVNVLALLVFAQTSLLTMKGCDSPLVGRVCQVLDAVYVGSALFGTDRDYVDAVYDKTELGDADITYVDVSGETPPLSYPAGYFQIANPEQQDLSMLGSVDDLAFTSGIPGIPSGIPLSQPGGGSLFDTAPNVPPSNPNPVDGGLPSGFETVPTTGTARNPIKKRRSGGRITPRTTPDEDTVADNGGDDETEPAPTPTSTASPAVKTDPLNPYDINKRPFTDLAITINDLLDRKLVNLQSPFSISGKGKLTKEGRLDPKSFRWGPAASADERMIDVVKAAVEAINASGYLQYLKDMVGQDFNLVLQQDETNVVAVIQSELASDNQAIATKSGLDFLLARYKESKQGEGADQNDKDDLLMLEGATTETQGKKLLIRFTVPKDVAHPIIQRKLTEQRNAPKPTGTGTPAGK